MAYYPFLHTQVNRDSSSGSAAASSYFTDELDKSSPATSFDLPADSEPVLRYTLTEINNLNGADTEADQMLEGRTSDSSAAIERTAQAAFQQSHTSQQLHPKEPLHPLPMELDKPFENTISSHPQLNRGSPSLLFNQGSSASSQPYQPEELANTVFQEHMHQGIEHDAGDDDYEEPNPQDDGIYRCPSCLTSYKARSALARHRRATLATILNHLSSPSHVCCHALLKCVDLSAGPLRLLVCSEPRCTMTTGRLDAMKLHVMRTHGRQYTSAKRKTYTLQSVQNMMGSQD